MRPRKTPPPSHSPPVSPHTAWTRDGSSAKKRSSEGVRRSALDFAVVESTPSQASRFSTAAASRSAFALRAGTTSANATPGRASRRAQQTMAAPRAQVFERCVTRSLVVMDHVIGQAEPAGEERRAAEALPPHVDRLAGEHVLLADGLD